MYILPQTLHGDKDILNEVIRFTPSLNVEKLKVKKVENLSVRLYTYEALIETRWLLQILNPLPKKFYYVYLMLFLLDIAIVGRKELDHLWKEPVQV